MITIKTKLEPNAWVPERAHATDVGYDVRTNRAFLIVNTSVYDPMELNCYVKNRISKFEVTNEEQVKALLRKLRCKLKNQRYLGNKLLNHTLRGIECRTGVHIQPPPGWWVRGVPNSRLVKAELVMPNSMAMVDPDYTGEVRLVYKFHNEPYLPDLLNLLPGKVCGQFEICVRNDAMFQVVNSLSSTVRGDGGFGSTAKFDK